jgi:hypothetical protein
MAYVVIMRILQLVR